MMMNRQLMMLTGAIALISMTISCTPSPQESEPSSTEQTSPDSTTEQTSSDESVAEDTAPEASEPANNLQTYNGPEEGIPVTAQYPADTMEVSSIGSGEGVGVFFTFKPQGNALDEAEVHVFLPSNASSTTDLMPMITGENGLIVNNGWSLDGSRTDTASEFPYPWFEMVFDISTDFEQSGHILIGQTDGQAIQVTVLYPSEMYDVFWPSASVILDSLEFDGSLLPVTNSL
jgi:hypothetical protein